MNHNTSWWGFGDGGKPEANAKCRQSRYQKCRELMGMTQSMEGIDFLLEFARNRGVHQKIRDIKVRADEICSKTSFSESRREAYVDFWCYWLHSLHVYDLLSGAIPPPTANQYRIDWYGYRTPNGEYYVWKQKAALPSQVSPHLTGQNLQTSAHVQRGTCTFFQYVQALKDADDSRTRYCTWNTFTDSGSLWQCAAGGAVVFVLAFCSGFYCWAWPAGLFMFIYFLYTTNGKNSAIKWFNSKMNTNFAHQ